MLIVNHHTSHTHICINKHRRLIKCQLSSVVAVSCTGSVDLLRDRLANAMPLLQHLNQTGQRLVVSWVQQLTGTEGWEAFYELTQNRVIYVVKKKKKWCGKAGAKMMINNETLGAPKPTTSQLNYKLNILFYIIFIFAKKIKK